MSQPADANGATTTAQTVSPTANFSAGDWDTRHDFSFLEQCVVYWDDFEPHWTAYDHFAAMPESINNIGNYKPLLFTGDIFDGKEGETNLIFLTMKNPNWKKIYNQRRRILCDMEITFSVLNESCRGIFYKNFYQSDILEGSIVNLNNTLNYKIDCEGRFYGSWQIPDLISRL